MKYINKRFKNYIAEVKGDSAQIKFISNGNEVTNAFPAELIIDSPDWQLKPSYEITAFRYKDDENVSFENSIAKLKPKGYYEYPSGKMCSYETMIDAVEKYGTVLIFSVRREDGIEFSLQQKTEQGEIEKFIINSENEMVVRTCLGQCYFHELTPAKKVILTTEDGVGLCDGDACIYVNRDFELAGERTVYLGGIDFFNGCKKSGGKYFSTREAAETFISQNKPKYSENQIREAMDSVGYLTSWTKDNANKLIHKLNEKK